MTQPPISLAILRNSGGWRVISDGGMVGDYAYRVDAEEAALRFAAASRGTGKAVEILLQEPGGELRPFTGAGRVG